MADIAIIGTGISGLGAAYLLNPHHRITVYEKSADIGGHSRTRIVERAGRSIPVDTGFIVFNYRNYPHLSAMFKHLDVPVQKSDMTFAITINGGEIEWGAKNLGAVFGQRGNLVRPRFLRLIWDVLRFNRLARKTAEADPTLTLGALMHRLGMSDWFGRYYILPMGGAIWSCPLETMLSFPAVTFTRFFESHGLLSVTGQPQWHTVSGGSREYVSRLIAPFKDRIRTSCAAVDVKRANGKVQVRDSKGEVNHYDHAVLACHAGQSLAMLKDASPDERHVLGAFRTQKNRAFLHGDAGVMPKRRRCWASWVYHAQDGDPLSGAIPVTYWMNLLQSIEGDPIFVTLNPRAPIAPHLIYDEHVFEHPVYSQQAVAAQQRLPGIQGGRNTWFCGAWARNGFHEDGLASAVNVAKALGAGVPW